VLGFHVHVLSPDEVHATGDDHCRAEESHEPGERAPQRPIERDTPHERCVLERCDERCLSVKASVIAHCPTEPVTAMPPITSQWTDWIGRHAGSASSPAPTATIVINQNAMLCVLSLRPRRRTVMADNA